MTRLAQGSSNAPQQAPQLKQSDSHSFSLLSSHSLNPISLRQKKDPQRTGGRKKDDDKSRQKQGNGAPKTSHFGNAATNTVVNNDPDQRSLRARAQTATKGYGPHKGNKTNGLGLSLCAPGFHRVCLYRLNRKYNTLPGKKQESPGQSRKTFSFACAVGYQKGCPQQALTFLKKVFIRA